VPRCGCPDFNLGSHPKKWKPKTLTYCIVNRDEDLEPELWDNLILEAFDSWSRIADITFVKIDYKQSANIVVDIGAGQSHHFDGPLGTLAWAYLPPTDDYTGQLMMKFDTDEIWIKDSEAHGTLLKNVAAHEIGHILGLAHSSVDTALMAPYYSVNVFCPQEDDISRIQQLYGKPTTPDKET
jgi:predicted Zn-dependent protease